MFLNNKYFIWYFNIITNAQSRLSPDNVEKHHIIPKSIGGSNSNDNLVKLTPREHFICHILLTKFTEGINKRKMVYASNRMFYGKDRYIPNSKFYENIRKEAMQNLSLHNTGQKRSPATCKKISESLKGKGLGSQTKEHIDKRISKIKGSTRSDETKRKMSEDRRGKIQTIEHIKKRQKSLIGKKRNTESIERYRISKTGSNNPNAKAVDINGKHYSTKHEACVDLGLNSEN